MKKTILLSVLIIAGSISAQADFRYTVREPISSTNLYHLDCYANENVSQDMPLMMTLRGATDEQTASILRDVSSSGLIKMVSSDVLFSGRRLIGFSIGKGLSFTDTREVNALVEKIFSDAVLKTGLTQEQALVSCNGINKPHPRAGGTTGGN